MTHETLLPDLQKFVSTLEDDLRERAETVPEIQEYVHQEYRQAKEAERTAQAKEEFQGQLFTQGAVAWVLSAVFVRFLEDNAFLDARDGTVHRWFGGHDPRLLKIAEDTQRLYFRDFPEHSERDYLLHVFEEVRELPGLQRLFDRRQNALWHLPISADAARDLLKLLRQEDPETGDPIHAFHDPDLDTRFLGDLYQDLSESARKRYALLQTPDFVEELILDYTLEPAIEEFGYAEIRLIDPACGSGHFLLGAFERLLDLHQQHEPAANERELVQRALHQVAGVDLNPFAVAIARFRLLVLALQEGGVQRLEDAPTFEMQVAAGDSLLHGRRPGELFEKRELMKGDEKSWEHYYATEDPEEAKEILTRRYHVVVGNPPYISVKDSGLRDLYREFYDSCYGKYTYVPPFLERFFDLAIQPAASETNPAAYVGAIVANAFMQRQFGTTLIEEFIPRWDLTHIIDTSGAYIPGHGTPTVILFGRHRKPIDDEIRAVLGIRGEPGVPENAAEGNVWSAIVRQIDRPGSESDFVSANDSPRARYESHPWSLQGGGATELKICLESQADHRLEQQVVSIGPGAILGEDEAFGAPTGSLRWRRLRRQDRRHLVEGQFVRNWSLSARTEVFFPYDESIELQALDPPALKELWPLRAVLRSRTVFGGQTYKDAGRKYWEYHQIPKERNRVPLSIAFAFVATHNHFVLDRGGKVFNRSAPVIKLPEGATEEEHLGLVGLLNSSVACFWIKQVCFDKGVGGIGGGIGDEAWEPRYEIAGTQLHEFPLIEMHQRALPQRLEKLGADLCRSRPMRMTEQIVPTERTVSTSQERYNDLLARMIAVQEELDWKIYRLYRLLDEDLTYPDDPPGIQLGERAFEIVMTRKMAAGDLETTWFERHGSTPTTEIPSHWSKDYQRLVQRRIDAIESNKNIRLIEKPEYKRRWNTEPWEDQEERALRHWLLDRFEADGLWDEARLTTTAGLADEMRNDEDFLQVAALYRGHEDFDLTKLVTELVEEEGVPYLAVQRYKASGLRRRRQWERVWELQREEDALEARTELPEDHPDHLSEKEAEERKAALEIAVPPKYRKSDFANGTVWRHRGKLDVPKEQFILYPGAEREADPTPVLGWAGWDHLERAEALATYYTKMRDTEGWSKERLLPLLAGLLELLPWLKQWHNEHDPSLGEGMGDHYGSFLEGEAHGHGVTLDDLKELEP